MALEYRGIWRDDRADLIDTATHTFQEWIDDKEIDLDVPVEGRVSSDGFEVDVRSASEGDVSAVRISLIEDPTDTSDNERWITTSCWIQHRTFGWVWIDVERESDNIFGTSPIIAAPNLAGTLLKQRTQADSVQLGPTPLKVGRGDVEALVEELCESERTIPIVLFSVDPSISPQSYSRRVKRTAKDLAGCADVRMLTADSQGPFNDALPDPSLRVFNGAVRAYLPGITTSDPQPHRHRYILSNRLSANAALAARRIGQMVLPLMLAQRPPEIYRARVKPLLDGRDWEEYALELDADLANITERNGELRIEAAIALDEAADSEREIDRLLRRLEVLRRQFRSMGTAPEVLEVDIAEDTSPRNCADALAKAIRLQFLEMHPDAPVDIDRLDEAEENELWAKRIWHHLSALNAYAEEKGPGFLNWCESSGSDRVIGSRFVAMSESQSVMNNPDLRRHRLLPVNRDVNPSERSKWKHT